MSGVSIAAVCAAAMFTALCAVFLRKYAPETASLIVTGGAVMIGLLLLPYAESAVSSVMNFSESASLAPEYISALVKSVGICFLTQLTADICRENGSASLASQVELCGRLAVLVIACPLYGDLLGLVGELLF